MKKTDDIRKKAGGIAHTWGIRLSIVVSVLAGFVGAISAFIAHPEKVPLIGPMLGSIPDLTLTEVSLVLFVLSIDWVVMEFAILAHMDKKSEKTNDALKDLLTLARSSRCIIIQDKDKIFAEASKYVKEAKQDVRSASFRDAHEVDPPPYWENLAGSMSKQRGLNYKHVYGYKDPVAVTKAAKAHTKFFTDRKLGQFWHRRFIRVRAGVDILIIDRRYVMMSLPTVDGDDVPRRAIVLPLDEDLAGAIMNWYDIYLWRAGTDAEPAPEEVN
jgi:hypothetical protein